MRVRPGLPWRPGLTILGFTYEKGRARRVAALTSPGASKAQGVDLERRRAGQRLTVSLASIIRAGQADGSFPDADPQADANAISVLVFDAAGLSANLHPRQSRSRARERVLSFSLRALGASRE